ncbi:hypothetical protein Tco_1123628 [Tanacetum coccineum]|uniref:Uncharacterized protein n=1 Tax=Tanacetum coccineum TaxID=301880 RepID=A0ABQ5J6N0_9ASTR
MDHRVPRNLTNSPPVKGHVKTKMFTRSLSISNIAGNGTLGSPTVKLSSSRSTKIYVPLAVTDQPSKPSLNSLIPTILSIHTSNVMKNEDPLSWAYNLLLNYCYRHRVDTYLNRVSNMVSAHTLGVIPDS